MVDNSQPWVVDSPLSIADGALLTMDGTTGLVTVH